MRAGKFLSLALIVGGIVGSKLTAA